MTLKIAILGTRGIPNHYGGFEQVTERLATGLTAAGHRVTVYNSHNHPYQQREWNGVRIVHCYDPEYRIGTAGQFVYDRNCIRHAARYQFDVILVMGYSSSSVWWRLFPSTATVIYNMDGLEWKRSKYSWPVRQFLKYAEKLAALRVRHHIADSMGVRDHLKTYGIQAAYIPYGAEITRQERPGILERLKLAPRGYFMLIARMEPENNVHLALEGFSRANTTKKFIVTGNTGTRYGRRMLRKYSHDSRIIFTGPLFDQEELHTLRANAAVYFHGHSVGGTNPSLLEAMASRVFIAAHDNAFNRSVLGPDAVYFPDATGVQQVIERPEAAPDTVNCIENNYRKILDQYSWSTVIAQYDHFIRTCYQLEHHTEQTARGTYAYQ